MWVALYKRWISSFESAKARPAVNRAVVMLVNAPPSVEFAGEWDSAQAYTDARNQAYTLATDPKLGIPIYVIALCNNMSANDATAQQAIYNDRDNNYNPAT